MYNLSLVISRMAVLLHLAGGRSFGSKPPAHVETLRGNSLDKNTADHLILSANAAVFRHFAPFLKFLSLLIYGRFDLIF